MLTQIFLFQSGAHNHFILIYLIFMHLKFNTLCKCQCILLIMNLKCSQDKMVNENKQSNFIKLL